MMFVGVQNNQMRGTFYKKIQSVYFFIFFKWTEQEKMKIQIEQYNKKKNATTQHQASQQTYHTSHEANKSTQIHPKHETKNPDNAHHLVLTNSITQMSSLAAAWLLHPFTRWIYYDVIVSIVIYMFP